MYCVYELGNDALVAYPEGDLRLWASKDVATNYALALSANNPGVFSVMPTPEWASRCYRYITATNNPLSLRSLRPN